MAVNVSDFIHPEDEAARRQMEAIPGFAMMVKGFLKLGYEQYFYGVNMANKIRLAPNQLPELYNKLPPICEKLGIAEPEFYLEMNPAPNAYTFGDTRIFLTVTSGLVEYLDEEELEAALAHECGHIICRHVLYHTMADILIKGAESFGLLGSLELPIQLALLYWQRRSELSADRAAAIVSGSSDSIIQTMVRLTGGPKTLTANVNIEAYAAQAESYDKLHESKWDKVLQTVAIMNQNHPFPAVRVREIKNWTSGEPFALLVDSLNKSSAKIYCPGCKENISPDWKFCKYCGAKL